MCSQHYIQVSANNCNEFTFYEIYKTLLSKNDERNCTLSSWYHYYYYYYTKFYSKLQINQRSKYNMHCSESDHAPFPWNK